MTEELREVQKTSAQLYRGNGIIRFANEHDNRQPVLYAEQDLARDMNVMRDPDGPVLCQRKGGPGEAVGGLWVTIDHDLRFPIDNQRIGPGAISPTRIGNVQVGVSVSDPPQSESGAMYEALHLGQ
jgi:hypothetical protein